MKLDFKLDDKGMRIGFDDFQTANKVAVRNTLNSVAGISRKNAVKEARQTFTLRNSFTIKQIQYEQAFGHNINKMKSIIGATQRAEYLAIQESGGVRPKRGRVTAIPQRMARSGGSPAKPVTRSKYIRKISRRIVGGRMDAQKSGTSRSRFVAQMAVAYERDMYVKRRNAIFSVTSFEAKNGRVRARLQLLYTIEEATITLRKRGWLLTSIQQPIRDFGHIYRSQLSKLLKDVKFK